MAFGTLKADTLTHSTAGSLDTNFVVEGSAKAWVNFNGTGTIATRDSFNTSSLTDNGTGDYDNSFTTSFSNANYTHSGMSGDGGTSMRVVNQNFSAEAPTSGGSRYQIAYVNGTLDDPVFVGVTEHGDLA